jgi:tetratricopeptide (TPR) repeat protein
LASYDAQTPGSDQARAENQRSVNRLITSLAILELTELDGDAETAKAHAARLLSIDPENTVGRLITEMAGKGRVEGLLAIATMAEPDDEQKRWERFWMALRNEKLGLEQAIVGAKADPGITTVAEFARLEDHLAQVSAELTTVEARILASESKSSLVLRYLVNVAIVERDFPAAEAALADLVARDGESWRTAISRARLHSVQGDAKTAVDVLAKAIEDGRTNSIVMRQYGRALLALGQIEDGTNALSTAYQNSPGDAATALDYSTALYRAGDSAESLQVLRRASNVGRTNPAFRARWLALEEQMGSSSVALAERLRVWEMNPADWRNGTSYGRLLVTADADWRDIRDPNTGRQLLNAAQWSRLPRTEKAKYVDAVRRERMALSEAVFTELTARPNASPVVFTSFADILEMSGERDRGVDMLKATIDDPDQTLGATERALLAIDLANRYFDVANRDEAKAWIKRARDEQPEGDPVADRMLVQLWQSKSDPTRLADALRQVLALDQSDGFEDRRIPNTRLLVRALLDAGGIEEAGKIFDEQLADSTMTPDLLIGGALRLEQARRAQIRGEVAQADTALESARTTFEQAALADSGAIEPSLQLARLFELRHQWFGQSEDIQTAIEHARSAMRRYQSSWIAQELLCLLLIRAEDLGTASGALEAYVEQNPSNDNSRLMLVRMYESMGKAERAVELCQAAVDRNPFSIPWNVRLGKLRGDQGRYTEAAIAFKRLFDITHDPAVARFFVEMRLLRDPPDYEGVLAFARANVSMFRNDPFLAGAYAATLAHGGRAQNAFNELETAYKRFRATGAPASSMQQLVTWLPRIVEVTNPEAQVAEQSEQLMDTFSNGDLDLGTRIVLANAWIDSGPDGQSKAIEHLRVVLAREDAAKKLGAGPYLTLGSLLYDSGDCEGSLDMFERALALAPNSALLMNNVAYARAQCDSDLERAVAEAIEASRLEPLNSSVLDTLGYILIKQGKLEAADTALRRSLARRRTVPALLHLAEVRILSNQLDDARTLLKEAGDRSPTPQQQSDLTALVARLAAAKEAP